MTFYYVVTTRGLNKACQPYTAEVCGTETPSSTYTGVTDFGKYDLSATPGAVDQPAFVPVVNTMFTSSSVFCGMVSWDTVMYHTDGVTLIPSTHLQLTAGYNL